MSQTDYGNFILAYSDYLYDEIDELISKLKSEEPMDEIKEQIHKIRQRTVQIILAAIEENK